MSADHPRIGDTRAKTFVLLPGAYAGGWLYARVEALLRAAGHRVHALTFTGLGERADLFRPDIDANTHARDIVTLIRANNLRDVVLVAHSYAGIPATGAADELGQQHIDRLIYIDALVPSAEMGWRDFHTEPQQEANMQNLRTSGGGVRLMPPTDVTALVEMLSVTTEDAQLLVDKSTPMPAGTYLGRVAIRNGGYARFRDRTFIECNTPPLPTIAQSKARVRSEPGWTMAELRSGHAPMLSHPEALVELLLA